MRLEGSERTRKLAKHLRMQMTPPEIALWMVLRTNEVGLRFRRQHPAGRYVLDFYCARAKLVVEIDGEAHERGDRRARDMIRDAWLADQGVRVLRYAARDVLHNLEGVVLQVLAVAGRRLERLQVGGPPPPPTPSTPPPLAGEDRNRLNPPPLGGGGSPQG
jgi:very-short-patch-repair endonuclease